MTRRIVLLAALAGVGVLTWYVGVMLNKPDLVWGMVFGALAGVPTALLVLYASRRNKTDERYYPHDRYQSEISSDAPTADWLADIEKVLEPYRLQDERLEQEAIQRDLEEGIDYPVGEWRQHRIEVRNG